MSVTFQIKQKLFGPSILEILSNDLNEIEREMISKIKQAPEFLRNLKLIIQLNDFRIKINYNFIESLVDVCRKNEMLIVGFNLASQNLIQNLQRKNFSVCTKKERSLLLNQSSKNDSFKRVSISKDKIINHHIRSGQQVISKYGDLIILSSVSSGAEILAKGNIHVYGTLRGRAIAGLDGDIQAKIFCITFEAEIVSIAGQYKVFEKASGTIKNNNCQIQLKNGKIMIG